MFLIIIQSILITKLYPISLGTITRYFTTISSELLEFIICNELNVTVIYYLKACFNFDIIEKRKLKINCFNVLSLSTNG